MVVLSFTVTDSKGRYVNGLKPTEFRILEDGIQQKIATFAEGSKPPVNCWRVAPRGRSAAPSGRF